MQACMTRVLIPSVAGTPVRSAGFSLIDLVGGVVLAVIALGGVITTTIAASKMRRVDQELVLAHQACRSQLEAIADMTGAQIAAQHGATFAVDGDADGTNDLTPASGATQPGSVTVAVAENGGPGVVLYRVTVLVRWTGANGVRSYSMTALKTPRRGS
jgi:hypothetical protein